MRRDELRAPELQGPGAIYVTGEDNLRLTVNNSAAIVLRVRGRFLTLEGIVQAFEFPLTPIQDRSTTSADYRLGEGWLLNVSVVASSGTPLRGDCFASLRVIRGIGGATQDLGLLTAGYVTAPLPLLWPGFSATYPTEGPGDLRSVTGADPGAGAECSETVPTGARWRLLAWTATLVTDATVANREPVLVVDDGALVLFQAAAGLNHAASTTRAYSAAHGTARAAIATAQVVNIPIADLILPAGARIRTLTSGIVAGDNWGAPQLLVEEWIAG